MIAKGLIRENMPNIVKSFLEDSLDILSSTRNCEEVKKSVRKIRELLDEYKRRSVNGEPLDYVIWVKGVPYVRGIKGFYKATLGFRGKDVDYYKEYLERAYEDLTKVIRC